MSKVVGVIVGRFQVPRLHAGHWNLITHAAEASDVLLVGIGHTAERDKDNPLPPRGVEYVVEEAYPLVKRIFFIEDVPGDDPAWVMKLEDMISSPAFGFDDPKFVMFGGRKSAFLDVMQKYSKYKDVVFVPGVDGVSATRVREEVRMSPLWGDEKFRAGIIYGKR